MDSCTSPSSLRDIEWRDRPVSPREAALGLGLGLCLVSWIALWFFLCVSSGASCVESPLREALLR
jgi:hypothetical protein